MHIPLRLGNKQQKESNLLSAKCCFTYSCVGLCSRLTPLPCIIAPTQAILLLVLGPFITVCMYSFLVSHAAEIKFYSSPTVNALSRSKHL